MTTWPFIFSTTAITAATCTLLFLTLCAATFFLEKFGALSGVEKFMLCHKVTKLFYFPIPIFIGLWYLLVDDTLKDDIVNGTTKTVFIASYMHTGFYLHDAVVIAVGRVLYGSRRFGASLFLHHFVSLIACSVGIYYNGKGQYFTMIIFAVEMASPLTFVSWMLAKAKLTHLSIAKVISQISVYLWHFRTLVELYFFYTLIKNWSSVWDGMPVPILVTIPLIVLLMTIGLTPHWTKVQAKRLYSRQYTISGKISFITKRTRLNNLVYASIIKFYLLTY